MKVTTHSFLPLTLFVYNFPWRQTYLSEVQIAVSLSAFCWIFEARRFQWIHRINNYSEHQLALIMVKMINDIEWDINISLEDLTKFIKTHINCFKNFGGDIETFLSKCKMTHARRVFSLEDKHRFILTMEDLECAIKMSEQHNNEEESTWDKPPPFGMYV